MRVLLLTEGTYPYSKGGVSTWCHELLNVLSDVEFDLLALTNDPTLEPLFPVPANVRVRNTGKREGAEGVREKAGEHHHRAVSFHSLEGPAALVAERGRELSGAAAASSEAGRRSARRNRLSMASR